MIAQVWVSAPKVAASNFPVFIHLVTPINRSTGDERSIEVITNSDSFVEVLRETAHQKVMHGLFGYEIFEALLLGAPF